MLLDEGKRKFIEAWGQLGINWGTNKTMGMIHALLIVSNEPLSVDDIMEELQISRGNVSNNLHSLMDWDLIEKQCKIGEKKEFFMAEKDVIKIFKSVIINRKRKELEPMIKVLEEIKEVEGNCEESNEFCHVVNNLHHFSLKVDKALTNLTKTEAKWILGSMLKFMG